MPPVIFSAHGVPRVVQQEAKRRSLNVVRRDLSLVTKVHMDITRYAREAARGVLIGHAGHPEVEGTIASSMLRSAARLPGANGR